MVTVMKTARMATLSGGVARLDALDGLWNQWGSSSRPYAWDCGRWEQSRAKTSRSKVN